MQQLEKNKVDVHGLTQAALQDLLLREEPSHRILFTGVTCIQGGSISFFPLYLRIIPLAKG